MQLAITDNLGQHYDVQGNGGVGKADGSYYEWSDNMKAINPQATTLTIIPTMIQVRGNFKKRKKWH